MNSEPEPLQQVNRTCVRSNGRTLSYFAGCDYFRMSSDPSVLRALKQGADKHGLSVAASRLTTGNHELYRALERALTQFFGAESALAVPTGYLSNLIVAQALARKFSHALVDERSHQSLLDATMLLECPVLRFQHRDPEDARRAAERCGPGAKLILLTDGMFSHNGSVAPLKAYLKALPKDALVLVDDAHGAGVLGRHGRGTPEHCGVPRDQLIQTITLSKAFGVYGGAVLGPASLRRRILEHSRIFGGSTPVPLPLVSAAIAALKKVKESHARLRQKLKKNSDFVKNGLRAAGFALPEFPGPIVMLTPGSARTAAKLKRNLLSAAIYPPFIKYHGGPKEGYFRFVISSEHTMEQLRALVQALTKVSTSRSVYLFKL